jgi:hypothetical protein
MVLQISGFIVWNNILQISNPITINSAREIWIERDDSTGIRYGYNSVGANNDFTIQNFTVPIVLGPTGSFTIYAYQNDSFNILINPPNLSYQSRIDILRLI